MSIYHYPIIQSWIPVLPKIPYRNGIGQYEGVVLHFTDNYNDNADIEREWETKTWRSAFVHEFIDPKQILQIANPDYKCWGAGRIANERFISIELCHSDNQEEFNDSYDMYCERAAEYLFKNKLQVVPAKSDGTGTIWSHHDVSTYLGGTDHQDPIAYLFKFGKTWQNVIDTVSFYYSLLEQENKTTQQIVNILVSDGNTKSPEYWLKRLTQGNMVDGGYTLSLLNRIFKDRKIQ